MTDDFSEVLGRSDAGPLPVRMANDLVVGMTKASVALSLGRKVPTTTRDSRIPVLTTAPEAYWITGDTGLKQTAKAVFTNSNLTAEEIAVVVPIPDSVVSDTEFSLWDAVRPLLIRAAARRLDDAVLFGTGAPASWGSSLLVDATAAGNIVHSDGTDLVGDVLTAAALVGADQYIPNGAVVAPAWQYRAAAQRVQSFTSNPVGADNPFPLQVAGLGIYTDPPKWEPIAADAIVADWSNVIIGLRQDITLEMFDTGVISDDSGAIILNLLQQDAQAMRMTMRVGYLLAKPVTDSDADPATKSPVAVVAPHVVGS